MFNLIKIGDKVVPMCAMASIDLYYRNIFHEDAIKLQAANPDEGEIINFICKMGFCMARFAEDRKQMNSLNEDSYLEWLEQFERVDYLNALVDIRKTYEGQQVTSSDSKKKDEEPSDR